MTHLQVKQPDIDLGFEKTFVLAGLVDAITSEYMRTARSWSEVGAFQQSSGVSTKHLLVGEDDNRSQLGYDRTYEGRGQKSRAFRASSPGTR
jgi:hypothetical protein